MSNWVLVSLPMFVYMGLMLDRSGVADTMMRNFVKVFGGIRGGLGLTVIVIGILLAASTGIVGASVVLLAMLACPSCCSTTTARPSPRAWWRPRARWAS
jgi:TRAP-type mannitol/chloroaromatic compound transport system permease large subunit